MIKLISKYIEELGKKNKLFEEQLNMAKESEQLRVSYSNMAWLILEVLESLGVVKMLDQVADQGLFQWSTNTTLYYNFNVGALSFYDFKKRLEMCFLNIGYNPKKIKLQRVGNMLKLEYLA